MSQYKGKERIQALVESTGPANEAARNALERRARSWLAQQKPLHDRLQREDEPLFKLEWPGRT